MFNPKWVFHATLPAQIVQTQEELDALGPGWANSPAEAHIAAGTVVDDAVTAQEKADRQGGADEIKLAEDLQAAADRAAQQALVEAADRQARATDLERHVEAVRAKLAEPVDGIDYGFGVQTPGTRDAQ